MNFARKRRAISYIMEVVMMTLVITALASVVLTWGLSVISDSRTALTGAVNARMNRLQESIIIEDVQMVDSVHMRVWIRNVGSVQVVVDEIYVANAQSTISGVCAPNTAPSGSPPLCPTGTAKLSLPVQAVGAVDLLVPQAVDTCTTTSTTTSVSGTTTVTATLTSTITSTTTTVLTATTYTAGIACGGNTYLVIASTNRGTTAQGSFTV